MPRLNFVRFLVSALFASIISITVSSVATASAVRTVVEVDRPVVLAGEDRPVYILVRFHVPEQMATEDKVRPPLNIALVLDRSGSMEAAGKLPYLKAAAKTILGRMTPRDRLAIIEYDDRVTVAWPSAPVEAPELIARVIDALEPRGNTDLVGGMLAGVAQVQATFRESSVNRVLLLSDGLANEGVTNPAEIRKLVRNAKKNGVPVTTLGLGLEYDEDLMQDIAEYSGGAYYYIENPKQSASVFQREISTLFRTAARDVDIRFTPGDMVKGIQVFGYASRTDGGATVVEFSDFHSGEQRTLVMRLELKGGGAGPASLGVLDFSYDDVAGGKGRDNARVIFECHNGCFTQAVFQPVLDQVTRYDGNSIGFQLGDRFRERDILVEEDMSIGAGQCGAVVKVRVPLVAEKQPGVNIGFAVAHVPQGLVPGRRHKLDGNASLCRPQVPEINDQAVRLALRVGELERNAIGAIGDGYLFRNARGKCRKTERQSDHQGCDQTQTGLAKQRLGYEHRLTVLPIIRAPNFMPDQSTHSGSNKKTPNWRILHLLVGEWKNDNSTRNSLCFTFAYSAYGT